MWFANWDFPSRSWYDAGGGSLADEGQAKHMNMWPRALSHVEGASGYRVGSSSVGTTAEDMVTVKSTRVIGSTLRRKMFCLLGICSCPFIYQNQVAGGCISSDVGYNKQIESVTTDSVASVHLLLSIFIKKSCRRASSCVTTLSGLELLAVSSAQLMAWPMKWFVRRSNAADVYIS